MWLSLVKLYLICCCQSLLQRPRLLLWWPGSHGWSWQRGCWCHSGCLWRRPGLRWCWLQLHFACCLSGCPGTSVAGNAEQEKKKSWSPSASFMSTGDSKPFTTLCMSCYKTTSIQCMVILLTLQHPPIQFLLSSFSNFNQLWVNFSHSHKNWAGLMHEQLSCGQL